MSVLIRHIHRIFHNAINYPTIETAIFSRFFFSLHIMDTRQLIPEHIAQHHIILSN